MTTSPNSNVIPADDVIRSFLLGRLDTVEQEKFEEQLMTDESLHTRVRYAEFQLADEFTGEQIGRIDRQRFLKNFLVTSERKRIVAASQALRQRLLPSIDARAVRSASWRHLFDFRQPAWRFAFGVLVLLLLIGSFWLVTREPKIVRGIIPRRIFSRPGATSTPQETHHPVNTTPPDHRDLPSSPPEHESSPSDQGNTPATKFVDLPLVAETDKAPAAIIDLPASDAVVRFQLAFEGNRSRPLRIEINGPDGQSVFSAEAPALEKNYGRIDFDVAARLFKSGDYRIRVSEADTTAQKVARYYFRVR